MSVLQLFKVEYQFVQAASVPSKGSGPAWLNRLGPHFVTISAASAHPKDILSVLTSDLTVPGGYSIEILHVRPVEGTGTEGNTVLA